MLWLMRQIEIKGELWIVNNDHIIIYYVRLLNASNISDIYWFYFNNK